MLDGTMRMFRMDNMSVIYYSNGDSKSAFSDGKVVYWYNSPKTRHTSHPDGMEVCEFDDGQIERRYADGTHTVEFADKTIKMILADGTVSESSYYRNKSNILTGGARKSTLRVA